MTSHTTSLVARLVTHFLSITLYVTGPALAQQDTGSTHSSINDLQRSYQMDRYRELADRGPGRG
jgi:hypothetical protein